MSSPAKRLALPTVLLVDDEELLRGAIARALEGYGYRVIAAADGAAAWELLQANGDAIQAVITDVVMPRMDGLELAQRVSTLPHAPPLIFISGYPRGGSIGPDSAFLPKPFKADQLAALIAQLASGGEPAMGH